MGTLDQWFDLTRLPDYWDEPPLEYNVIGYVPPIKFFFIGTNAWNGFEAYNVHLKTIMAINRLKFSCTMGKLFQWIQWCYRPALYILHNKRCSCRYGIRSG